MLIPAFIFGLLSSLHCIGMCGPIALMLPLDRDNQGKRIIQLLTYHVGRITAYSLIGIVFGLLGKAFFLAGLQQKLSIFAGIAMIIAVLFPVKIFASYNFSAPAIRLAGSIRSKLGQQLRNKSYKSLFILGLLNGFLPCGMVYVALFGALAMQDVALGALFMAVFGLGTVPMMSMIVYLQKFITNPFRNKIQKAIPYAVICIGTLFILRGLSLGIPYISPDNMSLIISTGPQCR